MKNYGQNVYGMKDHIQAGGLVLRRFRDHALSEKSQ